MVRGERVLEFDDFFDFGVRADGDGADMGGIVQRGLLGLRIVIAQTKQTEFHRRVHRGSSIALRTLALGGEFMFFRQRLVT